MDFNPRPLAGATKRSRTASSVRTFQSTPPCGGDLLASPPFSSHSNFNPRPLAGATAAPRVALLVIARISIHAPLRGRLRQTNFLFWHLDFNPRPLAGATPSAWTARTCPADFNPRPLAGATYVDQDGKAKRLISIHAPLRGRQSYFSAPAGAANFNPRPLAGATFSTREIMIFMLISIHAPLRGRPLAWFIGGLSFDFNPRPLAGATKDDEPEGGIDDISIHAPLRGRHRCDAAAASQVRFQSTPPCGGDPVYRPLWAAVADFNPRPLAGATVVDLP